MKSSKKAKLNLMPAERDKLKSNRIKLKDIPNYTHEELSTILNVPIIRAMEICALVEFQSIPTVGIIFAQDLISLGYYTLNDLKNKDGSKLIDELEQSKGVWTDPCVEDQCRLVVHYANHHDNSIKWWDFTDERKKYRAENGYPPNRPKKGWFETS
jgi:hypothetical protein